MLVSYNLCCALPVVVIHRDFSIFKYKQGIGFPCTERRNLSCSFIKTTIVQIGRTGLKVEMKSFTVMSCHCHPILLVNLKL